MVCESICDRSVQNPSLCHTIWLSVYVAIGIMCCIQSVIIVSACKVSLRIYHTHVEAHENKLLDKVCIPTTTVHVVFV